MEQIYVAFRSRQDTLSMAEFLKNHGFNVQIAPTPKQAKVGCGLSLKISPSTFYAVKRAVFYYSLNSFAGFFSVTEKNGKKIVRSI